MTRILAPVVVAVLALALWNAARGAAAENERCADACAVAGFDAGEHDHGRCVCVRFAVLQLKEAK